MKRILMSAAIMLFIAGGASAQTAGGNSSRGNSVSSSSTRTNTNTKTKKGKSSAKTPAPGLTNRKEYDWKNGQQSTPTGQEATGVNGGYAAIRKDTAAAKDTTKKNDQ